MGVPSLCLSPTFVFLISFFLVDARIALPPNVTVPALIGFGDSIIDSGNNNQVATIAKCNFPPYGKDFMGGKPTGRFSNGRIPTDFLAEALGLNKYLPAYLDPNLKPEELLTGVCFASGGAGFDPLTSTIGTGIPLSEQLNLFKEYMGKLTAMVGPERSDFIISNSVYVVVAGSNDISNNYFTLPIRRAHYDFNSYSDFILTYASAFIRDLYELGARRIAIFGAPPLGCVPSQRTVGGGPSRMCVSEQLQFATLYNSKLSSLLQSIQPTLPNSRLVYIDVYNSLFDIIRTPSKYGIEEVTKGCCGTGLIEVTLLCNKFDPVCPDDTKYLFWDSFHPTERGYQIIVDTLSKYIEDLI